VILPHGCPSFKFASHKLNMILLKNIGHIEELFDDFIDPIQKIWFQERCWNKGFWSLADICHSYFAIYLVVHGSRTTFLTIKITIFPCCFLQLLLTILFLESLFCWCIGGLCLRPSTWLFQPPSWCMQSFRYRFLIARWRDWNCSLNRCLRA